MYDRYQSSRGPLHVTLGDIHATLGVEGESISDTIRGLTEEDISEIKTLLRMEGVVQFRVSPR